MGTDKLENYRLEQSHPKYATSGYGIGSKLAHSTTLRTCFVFSN